MAGGHSENNSDTENFKKLLQRLYMYTARLTYTATNNIDTQN